MASDEWLRFLAENAADVLTLRTTYGTYLAVSPSCRRVLGYEPDELQGEEGYQFIHDADADVMHECHEKLLAGRRMMVTFRHRRKDGTYAWLESTTALLKHPDHPRGVIIGIARDVSRFEDRHVTQALDFGQA